MNWIKRIFARRRLYADLSEEIRQHLEEKVDDLVEQGMSREEAKAVARREFGNLTSLEERGREIWQWSSLESLFSDIRYALRQLRRSPSFALVTVMILALGIGANTAVFSVFNAVVLRPLPFADPDRLVSVQSLNTQQAPRPVGLSYLNFFDFRTQNQVFDHIVCYRDSSFTLTRLDRTVHVEGQIVSWDLFSLLGVAPLLGRGFLPEEEAPGTRVLILGHQLWQEQFGADPDIVGRSITLNGWAFTVVGVARAGFRFPYRKQAVQLWITIANDASNQRGARMLSAIARLKPEVPIEQARAQMDAIAGALAKQYPDDNVNHSRVHIQPELENLIGPTREPLITLMGAVGLVLLIACANLASLWLARTAEREREFALRASIGASRSRIVRQLLTEGLVLASLGGIAGLLFAAGCMRLLPAFLGDVLPRIGEAGIDRSVLIFTASLVLFTNVLFSVSPALQVAKLELVGRLREGAHSIVPGRDRLRGALVVGQIALSLTLLSGAALLVASLMHLLQQDPGFRPDHVLRFSLSLPESRYGQPEQIDFYDRLLERLSNLPGVRTAAGGGPLPLTGLQMNIAFNIPGRPVAPSDKPRSHVAIVTPGYFGTMGIPFRKGRDFTQRDDAASTPVLVVNEAFADRFFPGEDAIGKTIQSGAGSSPGNRPVRQIVGIVGNAKQSPLTSDPEPIYYFPFKQLPWFIDSVILRTAVPPLSIVAAARAEVASIDEEAAMSRISTMDELQSATTAQSRFLTLLLGGFAGMALLLSVVGLYGVLSHSVTKRTNEIGVRIALGANRSSVLSMVFKQALTLVGIGLGIGLAGVFAGGRILPSMLHGVSPQRPLLPLLACCIIVAAATAAAYLPARRAASIEPMQALRNE